MIDPINIGSLSSQATEHTNQVNESKRIVINEDFETVRTKSSELEGHVQTLKEAGFVNDDLIKLASIEAQEIFNRNVQAPGNELNGYNTVFHNNRFKLESLRAELERIGNNKQLGKAGNYLNGIDKEIASLEGIMNDVDLNIGNYSEIDLIKLQTKMHFITEHVEILSKVVEEVSSGVKTVLQSTV